MMVMPSIIDPGDALRREHEEQLERLREQIAASTDPDEVKALRRQVRRARADHALSLIRLRWDNRHTPW